MQTLCHVPAPDSDPFLVAVREQARIEGRDAIVNAIVVRTDGRVLILRRASTKAFLPNCWDLPGGHVEAGEALLAALRREVREEIGATIATVHALIAIWDWQMPARSTSRPKEIRQFEFLVELAPPELRLNPADFTEYRWIREADLPVFMENRGPEDTQMLAVLRRAFQVKARLP